MERKQITKSGFKTKNKKTKNITNVNIFHKRAIFLTLKTMAFYRNINQNNYWMTN